MITIDEAIIHAREVAKRNRYLYKNCPAELDTREHLTCAKYAEEQEQIAEWLEELKELRQKTEQDIYEEAYAEGREKGYSCGEFSGYNRAIDEFAEKCFEEQIEYDCPLDKHDIEQIAQQLKAGVRNE